MNDSIPTWWLAVSGISFALNAVLFLVLIIAVLKLIPAIQEVSKKVEDLTAKVEAIAQDVKETASTVKDKSAHILTSVESIASVAAHQFERFSPLIVGAMTALRIGKALNDLRTSKKPDPDDRHPIPHRKKLLGIF